MTATLRLWDVASGRLLHELAGHRGGVTALVVLPGGNLVSAGQEGTVLTWKRNCYAWPADRVAAEPQGR